jgi:hypothetical protein
MVSTHLNPQLIPIWNTNPGRLKYRHKHYINPSAKPIGRVFRGESMKLKAIFGVLSAVAIATSGCGSKKGSSGTAAEISVTDPRFKFLESLPRIDKSATPSHTKSTTKTGDTVSGTETCTLNTSHQPTLCREQTLNRTTLALEDSRKVETTYGAHPWQVTKETTTTYTTTSATISTTEATYGEGVMARQIPSKDSSIEDGNSKTSTTTLDEANSTALAKTTSTKNGASEGTITFLPMSSGIFLGIKATPTDTSTDKSKFEFTFATDGQVTGSTETSYTDAGVREFTETCTIIITSGTYSCEKVYYNAEAISSKDVTTGQLILTKYYPNDLYSVSWLEKESKSYSYNGTEYSSTADSTNTVTYDTKWRHTARNYSSSDANTTYSATFTYEGDTYKMTTSTGITKHSDTTIPTTTYTTTYEY